MSFSGKVGEFSYEDVEIVSLDLELQTKTTIEELKETILNALYMDVPIKIYSEDEVLSDDMVVDSIKDIHPVVEKMEGAQDEVLNTTVVGRSEDKWIVTGNNNKFRKIHIRANTTEDQVKILESAEFKGEHKFAIVDRRPRDGRWRGRRYALEHEDATIHLKDDGTVHVSYKSNQGDLRGYQLLPSEEEKLYDEAEVADRAQRNRMLAGVAGLVFSVGRKIVGC